MTDTGPSTSAALEATPDDVQLPGHITMRDHGGVLELSMRKSALRAPMIVGGGALLAFLGGFGTALAQRPTDTPVGLAAIAAVPILVYGYFAAVAFLNRTTVTVTRGALRRFTGPVPFSPAKDLPVDEIAQLVTRFDPRGWHVYWRDRSGKEEMLVSGLGTEQQAKMIERLIEVRLGIVDDAKPAASALPPGAEPVPWTEASSNGSVEASVDVTEDAPVRAR